MGMRGTTAALSGAEATLFYQQVIENMKLDLGNGMAIEAARARYRLVIDKIRIDGDSIYTWSDYNALQMQHSFARKLYGLELSLLLDRNGKAVDFLM
jgi:hypothetical protein